uniref:Uncharacterized protein n=1 Tax=Trichuris muris TaxID=70415 RepID=A0A5S6QY36_TRIMR
MAHTSASHASVDDREHRTNEGSDRFVTANENYSGKPQKYGTAAGTERLITRQRWDLAEKRVLALVLAEKMAACGFKQRSAESVRGQLRKEEHRRLVKKFKRKLQISRRGD